jgi:hypothetical protein
VIFVRIFKKIGGDATDNVVVWRAGLCKDVNLVLQGVKKACDIPMIFSQGFDHSCHSLVSDRP